MSRVKTIDTLFLLEDISDSDIAHFSQGPSGELDKELDRIRRLESSTIEELCTAFRLTPNCLKRAIQSL